MISREAALAAGLKRYFTGRPCKRGHVAERYVMSGGACCECVRLAVRADMTPEQREKRNASHRVENMTATRIKAKRARGRFENLTPARIVSEFLSRARARAQKYDLPFSLTAEDIVIPTHCPVLGIPLSHGGGRMTDASPSLDKVIPALGYVPGNVVVISNLANRIKTNATPWQLMQVAQYSCDRTFVAT